MSDHRRRLAKLEAAARTKTFAPTELTIVRKIVAPGGEIVGTVQRVVTVPM
jgi:hypothetical protein